MSIDIELEGELITFTEENENEEDKDIFVVYVGYQEEPNSCGYTHCSNYFVFEKKTGEDSKYKYKYENVYDMDEYLDLCFPLSRIFKEYEENRIEYISHQYGKDYNDLYYPSELLSKGNMETHKIKRWGLYSSDYSHDGGNRINLGITVLYKK